MTACIKTDWFRVHELEENASANQEDMLAGWRLTRVLAFSFSQFVSTFGSGLSTFALSVWLYDQTKLTTSFSMVIFSSTLTVILVTPFSGVLVDRWDRQFSIILRQIIGAACSLVMLILFMTNNLTLYNICIMKSLASLFLPLGGLAYQSSVSVLVPGKQLGRAIGVMQAFSAIVLIVTPAAAAMIMAATGLLVVLLVEILAYLTASIMALIVRIPRRPPNLNKQRFSAAHFLREASFGWTYISASSGLFALALLFMVMNIIGGTIGVLFRPLVLSFGSLADLGYLLSTGGIGTLLGGLFMSIWGNSRHNVTGALTAFVVSGVCLIVSGIKTSIPLLVVCTLVFSFCTPVLIGLTQTIWVSKVAHDIQGRVFSVQTTIAGITVPIAQAFSGPLIDYVFEPLLASGGALASSIGLILGTGPGRGIGFLFVIAGLLCVIVSLLASLYPPLRDLEQRLPDWIGANSVDQERGRDSG